MGKSSKRPWIVLACMVLIQGGLVGVVMNCLGVVVAAIRLDLGFRAGDISMYYMIRSVVASLLLGFTSSLFLNKNSKRVLLGLEVILVVSLAAMATFNELWQWYVDAVFAGIGFSCIGVSVPFVLNNWFLEKRGSVIGLTLASSGIFGAIFSPIAGKLIASMGWRSAVLVLSAIVAVMVIVPTLFLFVASPEEVGEKPYGWKPELEKETVAEDDHRVVPRWVYMVACLSVLVPASVVSFANQVPVFATALGYSMSVGATLTSMLMIGNLSCKILIGALADRIGIFKSAMVFLVMIVISMLLYLLGQGSTTLLSIGSICFGGLYAIGASAPSLMMIKLYGAKDYKAKLSKFSAIFGMEGAILSVVFPYIYDFTGSFNAIFIFGIVCCIVSFAFYRRLEIYSNIQEAAL